MGWFGKNNRPEFAVIGLGRFGSSVALTLSELGYSVLGIDSDTQRVQDLADELTRVVILDSTDEDALRSVDITSFDTVVVAIGVNFEANLMTTAVLRDLGVKSIVCKTGTRRQQEILLRMGATEVILPEHEAGRRLAHGLCTHLMVDHLSVGKNHAISQVKVPARLFNHALMDARLKERYGLEVLAVVRDDKAEPSLLPGPEFVLHADDMLTVLGSTGAVSKMIEELV